MLEYTRAHKQTALHFLLTFIQDFTYTLEYNFSQLSLISLLSIGQTSDGLRRNFSRDNALLSRFFFLHSRSSCLEHIQQVTWYKSPSQCFSLPKVKPKFRSWYQFYSIIKILFFLNVIISCRAALLFFCFVLFLSLYGGKEKINLKVFYGPPTFLIS